MNRIFIGGMVAAMSFVTYSSAVGQIHLKFDGDSVGGQIVGKLAPRKARLRPLDQKKENRLFNRHYFMLCYPEIKLKNPDGSDFTSTGKYKWPNGVAPRCPPDKEVRDSEAKADEPT